VRLSCGDGPFTYQWQKNGFDIVAATNATYTISSAALTDTATYTVVVTSPYGSASTGASLVVNTEPTASTIALGALTGEPRTLKIIGGAHPPIDADGDALAVVAVTQGANGATVTHDGVNATYTSASVFTGTDSFNYVVGDGRGGFATNTVTMTVIAKSPRYNLMSPRVATANGIMELTYEGIPLCDYALDWTTNLAPPIDWLPVITNMANTNGLVNFTNDSGESTQNYFRTRRP
jgi:hypothetical protein